VDYPRFEVRHARTGDLLATAPAARGETAYDALTRARVAVRSRCRGSTSCGLCHALVDDAEVLAPAGRAELALLALTGPVSAARRLLCQLRLPAGRTSLTVRIVPAGTADDAAGYALDPS
jgi:ferredoxin